MDGHGSFARGSMQTEGDGVEWYTSNGRALTPEERLAIARRRGICVHCGVRTHHKSKLPIMLRAVVTDENVWQGNCIRCQPDSVPPEVLEAWNVKFRDKQHSPRPSRKTPHAHGTPHGTAATPIGRGSSTANLSVDDTAILTAVVTPVLHQEASINQSHVSALSIASNSQSSMSNLTAATGLRSTSTYDGSADIRRTSSSSTSSQQNPSSSAVPQPPTQSRRYNSLNHPGTPSSSTAGSSGNSRPSRKSLPPQLHQQLRSRNPPAVMAHHMSLPKTMKAGLSGSIIADGGGTSNNQLLPDDDISLDDDDDDEDETPPLTNPEEIVQALQQYRDDDFLLINTLQEIRKVIKIETASVNGSFNLVIDVLQEILLDRKTFDKVMYEAIAVLWRISTMAPAAKHDILDAGVCAYLVDLLRQSDHLQSNNEEVAKWCLGCLASLARDPANNIAMVRNGGIETILETMKKQSNSPVVFLWSCRCLYTLVCPCDDDTAADLDLETEAQRNVASIEESGGVSILVIAMKQNFNESLAQLWAMRLLWRLASRPDDAASRNRVRVQMIEHDFMELGIKLLRARSTSTQLFFLTSELLARMLYEADETELYNSISECVPSVVRFMSEEKDDSQVQESGCRLLVTLCNGSDSTRQSLNEADALKAIINAMEQLPNRKDVVDLGLWGICKLCLDGTTALNVETSGKMIAFMTSLMEKNKSKNVIIALCGVLSNATEARDDATFVVTSTVLQDVIDHYIGDALVLETAIDALITFCHKFPDEDCVEWLGVSRILSLCHKSVGLSRWKVYHVCGLIAPRSAKSRHLLVTSGLLDLIVAILREPLDAQYQIMMLNLITLLLAPDPVPAVEVPKQVIKSIMELQCSNEELVRSCLSALRSVMNAAKGRSRLEFNAEWAGSAMSKFSMCWTASKGVLVEWLNLVSTFARDYSEEATSLSDKLFSSLLGVLRQFSDEQIDYDGDVLASAARAFSIVVSIHRTKALGVEPDDVETVIASIYKIIENDEEAVDGLADFLIVLTDFCSIDADAMLYAGVVVVLSDVMAERDDNVLVQSRGCHIIAMLASSEDLQVILSVVQTEGVDLLVAAMSFFRDNLVVQREGCKAFAHLSTEEESRALILAQGGFQVVANALTAFDSDEQVAENAFKALRNLSIGCDANTDLNESIIVDTRLVTSMAPSVHKFSSSASLQETCLELLTNISKCGPTVRRLIADSGGIDIIVSALQDNIGNLATLKLALAAFAALVVKGETAERFTSRAIDAAINAMLASIEDEGVQSKGCECIESLCETQQALLLRAGGMDAIGHAMRAHYGSSQVQTCAVTALSCLTAYRSPMVETIIATEPDIRCLITAMHKFSTSEVIQLRGCMVLRNFLHWPRNISVIKSCGSLLRDELEKAQARYPQCHYDAAEVLSIFA